MRFLLFLLLLDLLLLAGLALPGRVRRLMETVWTVRLVAGACSVTTQAGS
jgi:hypothetical protein